MVSWNISWIDCEGFWLPWASVIQLIKFFVAGGGSTPGPENGGWQPSVPAQLCPSAIEMPQLLVWSLLWGVWRGQRFGRHRFLSLHFSSVDTVLWAPLNVQQPGHFCLQNAKKLAPSREVCHMLAPQYIFYLCAFPVPWGAWRGGTSAVSTKECQAYCSAN